MSAEGLLLGGLLRAIQATADAGWSEAARQELQLAAGKTRSELRRIAVDRALAIAGWREAEPPPAPKPEPAASWVSDGLTPVERAFCEHVAAQLARRGAVLRAVQRAYGEIFLTAHRVDGTIQTERLAEIIDPDWCQNRAGTILGRRDVVGRLSAVRRKRVTASASPESHPGNEDPHAQPASPDSRDRRGAAPAARPATDDAPRLRRL